MKRGHHERTLDIRRQGSLESTSLGKDVMLCPSTPLDNISSDGLKGPTRGCRREINEIGGWFVLPIVWTGTGESVTADVGVWSYLS